MAELTSRLDTIRTESGPEATAFAVTSPSGTPLSDSIDWIERFIRLFGSPNTLYSTEICNWHKDFAHAFTFGTALPSPDYAGTDLAVLWGHNPAKSWLAQSAALAHARSHGARLAVIDPRRSTSATRADHWLAVRPGTDAALALGIANQLLAGDDYDHEFVRAWTNGPLLVRSDNGRFLRADEVWPGRAGFVIWDTHTGAPAAYDTTKRAVRPAHFALRGTRRINTAAGPVECTPAFEHYADACAAWPIDRTAEVTGVASRTIQRLVDEFRQARSVAYAAWSGVGQDANATQTERAIATLYALTGGFDAPGGNVIRPKPPTRSATSPEQLTAEQRAKALGAARFPLGPPSQGWINARDFCHAVMTGDPYRLRALVSFGTNLLLSHPDPRRTAQALRELEFSVHIDLFENPTARYADLLLPANSPWEHEAVKAGFEISHQAQQHVQFRPRMVEPVGESRSDTEIVFDLATRLGLGPEFFGGDIETAWNDQLAPLGLTVPQLRERPGGTQVATTERHHKHAEQRHDGRVTGFATPTRRVELYSERLAEYGHPPVPAAHEPPRDERFSLTLTCAKNGYFCHSQHHGITSLRKRTPEPNIDINDTLARRRGIRHGQWVHISTRKATVRMRARIDPDLRDDVVVAEYGWWQEASDLGLPGSDPLANEGLNYNLLAADEQRDPISGSIPLRCIPCDVQPDPDHTWLDWRELVIDHRSTDTPTTVELQLRSPDGATLPDYQPGQHITITTSHPHQLTRSYSLTGAATEPQRQAYTIAIRKIDGGQFSTAAHEQFQPGTRLHATPPAGLFTIPVEHTQPIVLLAAGIGITPFLGYLQTVATADVSTEIVLHHGNRNQANHPFRDRIHDLARSIEHLRVIDHYSQPVQGDTFDRHGHITAQAIAPELIERSARFYLCGPQSMLTEVTTGLLERGVPRHAIFTERFHTTPNPVTLPDNATATVRFARTNRELRWRKADGTLLQLAERAGIPLPNGCRLGQCESCTATVLDGTITHLTTPPEDLPPEHCLTCQAVPTSDLALDA